MFAIIAKVVGSVYLWSSNWPQTFFQCRISNCTTSKPVFHFYQICSSTNFSEICSKFCPPTCPEGSSCRALRQADWRAIYGRKIRRSCPRNLFLPTTDKKSKFCPLCCSEYRGQPVRLTGYGRNNMHKEKAMRKQSGII